MPAQSWVFVWAPAFYSWPGTNLQHIIHTQIGSEKDFWFLLTYAYCAIIETMESLTFTSYRQIIDTVHNMSKIRSECAMLSLNMSWCSVWSFNDVQVGQSNPCSDMR